MPDVWKISAPNAVQLFDFRDSITKQILDNASITAKLLDHLKAGDIANSSFSIPLVGDEPGHYGGNSPSLSFVENTLMWLRITGLVNAVVVYEEDFEVVASFSASR